MRTRTLKTRASMHWMLAGGVAAGLVLGGCSSQDAGTSQADVAAQAAAEAARNETPPPTFAAQFEQRLVDMGATHADQGLVLMLDQPVADASQGKSGQAGQPSAAEAARAHTDVVDRVADLLKERPELQVEIRGDSAGAVAALLKERRAEIDPGRVRTGGGTDRGPLQFVLADAEGRFESRLPGAAANGAVAEGGVTGSGTVSPADPATGS